MWNKYPDIYSQLSLTEKLISDNMRSRNKLLSSVVSELVGAGGKRLRPAFVIISAKFGKYNAGKVIPMAGALELLHTATLVHDDVIDCSSLRRGKATVSEKYGNDMAIYTGDFLFTKAVMMLSAGIPLDRLEMVARAVKTICEGEVDQYQDRYNADVSVLSYLKRISRKTAVLFASACSVGSHLAKCSVPVCKNLTRFGFCYGMAFQIRDDLNNFLSDTQSEGKPVGSDIAKGVLTLPVIYAINESGELKSMIKDLFKSRGQASQSRIERITGLIAEAGGTRNSERILESYINRAFKLLGRLPGNKYNDIFKELLGQLKA